MDEDYLDEGLIYHSYKNPENLSRSPCSFKSKFYLHFFFFLGVLDREGLGENWFDLEF